MTRTSPTEGCASLEGPDKEGRSAELVSSSPATGLAVPRPDACMDPWLTVDATGETCLFGYALLHPRTGGLSWVLTTPLVGFDRHGRQARTASGRLYALGREIRQEELDEEGAVALRLLVRHPYATDPASERDRIWLASQKMARHLGAPPPTRNSHDTVIQFVALNALRYRAVRSRKVSLQ